MSSSSFIYSLSLYSSISVNSLLFWICTFSKIANSIWKQIISLYSNANSLCWITLIKVSLTLNSNEESIEALLSLHIILIFPSILLIISITSGQEHDKVNSFLSPNIFFILGNVWHVKDIYSSPWFFTILHNPFSSNNGHVSWVYLSKKYSFFSPDSFNFKFCKI